MEKQKRKSGCLGKIISVLLFLLLLAIIMPGTNDSKKQKASTSKPTTKATATIKATARPTATQKPTAIPTETPTPTPTPTATPATPGTYRPGIEGTNAYDITVAMKQVGLDAPKRQSVTDGYSWQSKTYVEGNVSYNIEIETDEEYRVTTMQIMMSGGNNNFVWWACACMFGEDSEQVAWLKDHIGDGEIVTTTFNDAIWTIYQIKKGVMLTVQHVDAEKWYLSMI